MTTRPPHIRRTVAFILGAFVILGAFYVLYSVVNTLGQLDRVEQARDGWQRPEDILAAMDLRPGNSVVDLGSGAGYFSLKLAPMVGASGRVTAVDLRNLSLFFLKLRTLRLGFDNVHLVTGDPNDPHLAHNSADAVLICNTYHELSQRQGMLQHVFQTLRSGGRVVVADREPKQDSSNGHEIAMVQAAADLETAGFQLTRKDPMFLTDPDREVWWLLVAVKP